MECSKCECEDVGDPAFYPENANKKDSILCLNRKDGFTYGGS